MNVLSSVRMPGIALAALTLVALSSAGCAPDAIRYDAAGFNAYIKKLGQVCQPLRIGEKDVGEMIRLGGASTTYDFSLDPPSKLYYNRLTAAAYRQSLISFLGPGTSNDRAF